MTDLVQLLLDHPALGYSQQYLDLSQAVSNLCHDAHGGIIARKGCLQNEIDRQTHSAVSQSWCSLSIPLAAPFCLPLLPPVCLLCCGGYQQSRAGTVPAVADPHAVEQSSLTPERKHLQSVQNPPQAQRGLKHSRHHSLSEGLTSEQRHTLGEGSLIHSCALHVPSSQQMASLNPTPENSFD